MSDDQQEQVNQGGAGWQSATPSAGWYQDPWDSHRRRYWDGQRWTGNVSFEPPGSWVGPQEEHASWAPAPAPASVSAADEQQAWMPQGATVPRSTAPPVTPAPQPMAAPGAAAAAAYWQPVPAPQEATDPHPAVAAEAVAPYPTAPPEWPPNNAAYPTRTGWGGGGWGQPPQVPGPWGTAPPWQTPAPAAESNRIHVGIVALIAAISVVAGIGIGSQLNRSSTTPAASSGGTVVPVPGNAGLAPFGGGTGSGVGGSTGGSGGLSAAQQAVATKVNRSIVDINTQLSYQNGAAAGTGMVLSSNGVILTNNHVIDGATAISVTVVSTGKQYKADVVGTDVTEDVAVLQMQNVSGLTPITIARSNSVSRGDQVIALGNAGGAGGTPSAVTGVINALNQTITASDSNGSNAEVLNGLIQTDAPIQAGDSGGPLVDSKGEVIGMDTAASSSNQINGSASVGFAIPISNASTIATAIQQGKTSDKIHIGQTGFLGVSVGDSTTNPTLPGAASIPGAAITKVIAGSPADKAGMTPGDTITSVDGVAITTAPALTATLRDHHHPGDRVSIAWTDSSNAPHSAMVTLVVGPAA